VPSLLDRLLGVAIAEDEAANAALGGDPRETISGTIGRAWLAGARWARPARALVDVVFGKGHCLTQAAKEAARRRGGP
jgi:hypothetical protein